MTVSSLHRTLEQELLALLRGASLECPVCGEFVLHEEATVRCPECELVLYGRPQVVAGATELGTRAG
jgi:rubrerythrin